MSGKKEQPVLLIVMGTSGCGKSTFGTLLAQQMGVAFIDGDDLHPPGNVAKMSRGEALDDEDRLPWLHCIREKAIEITHPVHGQQASERERSSRDEPGREKEQVREMAAVLETTEQVSAGTSSSLDHQSGTLGKDSDNSRRVADKGDASLSRACVIACSALKRKYRDLLRGGADSDDLQVVHIYLQVSPDELLRRMHERKGHFMKESMLKSQLATLEEPIDEHYTIVIEDGPPQQQVRQAKEQLVKMIGN